MKDMSIFTIIQLTGLHNFRVLYRFLIAVSLLALLSAYATEYIMNLPPCVLCVYQRYCYYLLILLSAVGIAISSNKWIFGSIAATLLSACLIAGYHASVERGIVKASERCSSQVKISDNLSVNEIKDMLYEKPVASCERAALKFVGLSMAEWNLILNLGLLVIWYNVWKLKENNHAET